jgi:hypothetical protein
MKLPNDIPVYGDKSYRGACASETAEQVTFFARIRRQYPDTWGLIAIHPRNEGKRSHYQVAHQKAEGMTTGAVDIIIPGSPAFVCELKRRDHTQSTWQPGQEVFLRTAQSMGAFACVALGADGATKAFTEYLERHHKAEQVDGESPSWTDIF